MPSPKTRAGHRVARPVEFAEVHEDGQHAGPRVADGLELAAVELGVADGQVDLVDEQLDLQAPLVALARQDAVVVEEEVRAA